MRTIIFIISICFALTTWSQITNGDMETYTVTTNDTLPIGWKVNSPYSSIPGKTNDAQNGTSAFVINTWYSYAAAMMVNGNLAPADFLSDWIKAGTPVTGKPTALKGFYKYTNVVAGDSAIAKVILKKWNIITHKPDTIAFGVSKLAPANSYTNFTVALTDYSVGVQPDSIVVYFMSYDYLKGTQLPCADNTCRFLYLDNLSLTQPVGIKESKKDNSVAVYYANNELIITNTESKKFSASVYSLDGKLILQKEISDIQNKINVPELSKGIYILQTKGEVNLQQKFFKD